MVGFFDLSNELILMIWDVVEVEDVYNFSTLSKKVYLLTQELLKEHCRLEHRLSTISNIDAKPGAFARMLKEVLLNPRAARYPLSLEIRSWELGWGEVMGYSRGIVPESDLGLFKQAARDIIDVPEKELQEDWLEEIDNGDEGPLIALLLSLLPNLRKVSLGTDLTFSPCIHDMLRLTADHENSSSLRKLHSVVLSFEATPSDDEFVDFDYARGFADIPSVTSIEGHAMGSDPEDLLHTPPYCISPTSVTSLSFYDCLINPKAMSEFLSTTHKLQHFFYSPMELAGNPAAFDPFWIRTALLTNARDTLKSLTILAGGHDRHFMGSLFKFTCLESVETDFRFLIGDPPESSHWACAILPSSIVYLKVHIKYPSDGAYYQAFLQDIANYLLTFNRLDEITVKGVADVAASELSLRSIVSVLERRPTRLVLLE